ncbi:hypothetical protein [Pseudomonas citronellolis]|uniref:hypothetical protein n=1 Tax=Pseudomonas citronellolis TaxID=53408 RepID=UPI0023E397A3|nr:hypothetical protein [Pseudomonas citronellolis]MDF3935339.1 hypothetical protein [Pseudomonas citronellolis]
MRMGFAAAVVLGLTAQLAQAANCEEVLNQARNDRHLTLVQDEQTHVQFQDGPQVQASIGCDRDQPNVQITWDGANPDGEFFALVGRLGHTVTGQKPAQVIQAAKTCRKQALQDGGEISQVEQPGMAIECQAFARDGGSTTITVYAD